MKAVINRKIHIFLFLIIIFDLLICKKVNNNFISFANDEIATINSDNEIEFFEAIKTLNKNYGAIYIDTPVITLNQKCLIDIYGELPGGIIGKKQPNEEYPKIKFSENCEKMNSGINIFGSNKLIKYMIIENSPTYGVSIIGDKNRLDHVISRYNYDSGFAIYGDSNECNYCYSYRNFNVDKKTEIADGFKILGKATFLSYCFAWDNGNCGFNLLSSSGLTYYHSGSWNNGNINVFTGKYDYDNGSPLDKNLWTIKDIIESDPNFESNYNNKKYSIEEAKIDGFSVKPWISIISPYLKGIGFTFGIKDSSESSESSEGLESFGLESLENFDDRKIASVCSAFDHKSGGFIDNFIHNHFIDISRCVSFNNGMNYRFHFISEWYENFGWGSKNEDDLGKFKSKRVSNTNTAQSLFYAVRDQIIIKVSANMFPEGINFDDSIAKLTKN